jgi:hypothetical protein
MAKRHPRARVKITMENLAEVILKSLFPEGQLLRFPGGGPVTSEAG